MPLNIKLIRLELPADVLATLRDELASGGIDSGFCFLGSSPIDSEQISLLWHRHGDTSVSVVAPPPEVFTPDWARTIAGVLIGKWKVRHDGKLAVLNQLAALRGSLAPPEKPSAGDAIPSGDAS